MKLTPIQRYSLYLLMYAERLPINLGFCNHLNNISGISNRDVRNYYGIFPNGAREILKLLPELKRKEPKIYDEPLSSFWFSTDSIGNKKRIKLLKECINEMEEKLF